MQPWKTLTHFIFGLFLFFEVQNGFAVELSQAEVHSEYQSLTDVSPQRFEGENFEEASQRTLKALEDQGEFVERGGTPQVVAVPYDKLDLNSIPEWDSYSAVQTEFIRIRNQRYLPSPHDTKFSRRIPWLFPDDGCFLRAEKSIELLESAGKPVPKKVFLFGDLAMSTRYSSAGRISWWYHVVAAVRVGKDVYVFDPTVDSSQPLPLKDWISRMAKHPSRVKLAICSSTSYTPYIACDGTPAGSARRSSQKDGPRFLSMEWNRMLSLGMNPKQLLGDNPPW